MKPKLPEGKAQSNRITFRLKDWVINTINLSGLSRSEFSRQAVEKEAKRQDRIREKERIRKEAQILARIIPETEREASKLADNTRDYQEDRKDPKEAFYND